MYNLILESLNDMACKDTGACQINFQSESARRMIADKVYLKIKPEIDKIIEDIIVGETKDADDFKFLSFDDE